MAAYSYNKKSRDLRSLRIALLCLIPTTAYGAIDVNTISKNLLIQADSLEMTSGKLTLTGNVLITGEMLNVRSDFAEIAFKTKIGELKADNIKSILLLGKQQKIRAIVRSAATYNVECTKVLFMNHEVTVDNASISHNGSNMYAKRLTYNTQTEKLSMDGQKEDRVKISLGIADGDQKIH